MKNIREGYAYYKREVDDDSTALKDGDFEDILRSVWKLLEQVDLVIYKYAGISHCENSSSIDLIILFGFLCTVPRMSKSNKELLYSNNKLETN